MKLVLALLVLAVRPAIAPGGQGVEAFEAGRSSFIVYDNMFYKGKPNTLQDGLVASNIVYENHIWPQGPNLGTLPDRSAFQRIVRAHSGNRGPLVLDIEKLPVKGDP